MDDIESFTYGFSYPDQPNLARNIGQRFFPIEHGQLLFLSVCIVSVEFFSSFREKYLVILLVILNPEKYTNLNIWERF